MGVLSLDRMSGLAFASDATDSLPVVEVLAHSQLSAAAEVLIIQMEVQVVAES